MEACNAHYYGTRDPLGAHGDFTTAPEVSQIFGELVGASLADCWCRAGSPPNALYAELGPGRGTLAADALRVLRAAGFAGEVHLVETSPVLRERQAQAVPDAQWHDSLDALPRRPLLLVANEFLDALPTRQFVGQDERHVVLAGGELAFDRHGEIVERSPHREAAVKQVAERLARDGGAALVIDYGHALGSPGDTLQAVRVHQYTRILAHSGEQDLTSHVDFSAVSRAAVGGGASVSALAAQGDWLNRLGIGARAAALANANPERATELAGAVQRLTGRDQMGELFKVLAIHSPHWPEPAGFA
jgi:SAM-dependent MidA family methyltransferase